MALACKVSIHCPVDILTARQKGRELAMKMGFTASDVTVIASAISEIASNIVDFAQQGEMRLEHVSQGPKAGIQIVARDEGPGISNIPQAMQYGYSSRSGLGYGLPGAKWFMDEFNIVSKPGKGTTVTMKKWLNRDGGNDRPGGNAQPRVSPRT